MRGNAEICLDPRVRPARIVRLTCFFRSNPLSLPHCPVLPLPVVTHFSLFPSCARARARSPFLYDRPDPVSPSLSLSHSISPFPPPRACVRVGACGSAVELVNGLAVRCSRRQPRSFPVRAFRGHREVLVSKPIERLRGTRALRQRAEKERKRKAGKIDGDKTGRTKELGLKGGGGRKGGAKRGRKT